LAIISTHFRIDFEGYGYTFESAMPKGRPALRVARRNGGCGVATLANGKAISCAPRLASVQPHNASHAESQTGC